MLGRTVAHYRITDRLGGGGMGVVYKAEDMKLGRPVALKFLPPELTRDPDAKHRFEREARAASLLDHPNICTIHEVGEADGDQMFIAMAFYDGESLASTIARGRLTLNQAIDIVQQIARGLGKAHSSGIVHRDIKPANVMVTSDGIVKIVDFGLAKLSVASHLTKSRTSVGTVAYMSPEQLRGEDVGPQTDIWALGIVLFELLTGTRPFRGEYEQAISYSILNEQPATLTELRSDLPPELDRVIKRMLRKDALQRYQSVDEVIADLDLVKVPSSGSGAHAHKHAERQRLNNGARLGPYEIVKQVGSGGMGDVYLSRDTRLDRQVAIKVLAPEFSEDSERKQRFKREAKTISSLSHPNICTLFDVGEQEGIDFLVMEYLEGGSLAERLARGTLPIEQVLKLAMQIAAGLAAAHRQGIVHRDLKPANVMITSSGAVKLLDFGLAKDIAAIATPRRAKSEDITAEGTIVGTLPYMAPEQIAGGEADARTDIFAFGAILYEMLTGRRAFAGDRTSLIAAIMSGEPTLLSEVQPPMSPALQHVIQKCLSKDPEERWQSAHDVADELRWISSGGSDSASFAPTLAHAKKREAVAWSLLLIVIAVALGAMIALSRNASDLSRSSLQVSLAPPRYAFVDLLSGPMVLSPDGRYLALSAASATSARVLWLQDLSDGTSRVLPTTEGGRAPFWSPDGRSIAFFAHAKLMKIDITGKRAEVICDAPFGVGGSWNRNGMILFAPNDQQSLYRVPASGGNPVPVTQVNRSTGESGHGWPFFLPDGDGFLYVSLGSSEGALSRGVFASSLSKPNKVVKVIDSDGNAAYGKPYLLFARDGVLRAQKFDPRAMKTSGEIFDIGPTEVFFTSVMFTVSDCGLLVLQEEGTQPVSQLTWTDRTGRVLGYVWQPGYIWSPRLSFDQKKVAIDLSDKEAHGDIWVVNTEDNGATRLTFEPTNETSPIWSPDGRELVFHSENPQTGSKVMRKALPNGGETPLIASTIASSGKFRLPSDWSSDGRAVLFLRTEEAAGTDIIAFDVTRKATVDAVTGPHNQASGSFSPDGKWIAYASDESGAWNIYVTPFPPSGSKWQVSAEGGYCPRWSRDGNEIVYIDSNGDLMAAPVRTGNDGFQARAPVKLFHARVRDNDWIPQYDIAADGRILLNRLVDEVPPPMTLLVNWRQRLEKSK